MLETAKVDAAAKLPGQRDGRNKSAAFVFPKHTKQKRRENAALQIDEMTSQIARVTRGMTTLTLAPVFKTLTGAVA